MLSVLADRGLVPDFFFFIAVRHTDSLSSLWLLLVIVTADQVQTKKA